jgi:hypothetical protein
MQRLDVGLRNGRPRSCNLLDFFEGSVVAEYFLLVALASRKMLLFPDDLADLFLG